MAVTKKKPQTFKLTVAKPSEQQVTPAYFPSQFGKDHWSLMAYLEIRCVDHRGEIDRKHLRCNIDRHPMLAWAPYGEPQAWKSEYGTRLAGYFMGGDKRDTAKQLPGHDDWDCLDDLADNGFVEIISLVNGLITITPKGNKVAAQLREHKTKGLHFYQFVYQE